MTLTLGITGAGLAVPGATPGTGVGGVPDGSAVVVPGGTGVPGKPDKAQNTAFLLDYHYYILDYHFFSFALLMTFIAFIAKDVGPSGTPKPGTVKCQYSACPRTFNVYTFTYVHFYSSCMQHMGVRWRSAISTFILG